jgi:hypothetical protein
MAAAQIMGAIAWELKRIAAICASKIHRAVRAAKIRHTAISNLCSKRHRLRFKRHHRERTMKRIALALLITAFAAGSAMAQSCESKAMSKDGKPLAGAAKTSFVKKCKEDACAGKAMSKDGKPLAGAAKTSFMTKCEKES